MKKIILFSLILIIITSCKNEPNKMNPGSNEVSANLNIVFEEYYQEELKLYPISATFKGDKRYNNSFPNSLSDEHRNLTKKHYASLLNKLNEFNNSDLIDDEIMSKDILKWECEINLEYLRFSQDYFPIRQMGSYHLLLGQFASGASAQPFETIEDYQNWLQRVDEYLIWLSNAETKMREGMSFRICFAKIFNCKNNSTI